MSKQQTRYYEGGPVLALVPRTGEGDKWDGTFTATIGGLSGIGAQKCGVFAFSRVRQVSHEPFEKAREDQANKSGLTAYELEEGSNGKPCIVLGREGEVDSQLLHNIRVYGVSILGPIKHNNDTVPDFAKHYF